MPTGRFGPGLGAYVQSLKADIAAGFGSSPVKDLSARMRCIFKGQVNPNRSIGIFAVQPKAAAQGVGAKVLVAFKSRHCRDLLLAAVRSNDSIGPIVALGGQADIWAAPDEGRRYADSENSARHVSFRS